MTTKTKGRKVKGIHILVKTGSTIVGCMTWETPYLVVEDPITGEQFRWVSDNAGSSDIFYKQAGSAVYIDAFARQDSNHLYRVKRADYHGFPEGIPVPTEVEPCRVCGENAGDTIGYCDYCLPE